MTVVVPFDNSRLSKAALRRGIRISEPGEEIVAVAVIPNDNAEYARGRDWLDPDEPFDPERITTRLSETVSEIHPAANFEYIVASQYANAGEIASKIRSFATDAGARTVILGSDNAGRIVSGVGSIGRTVAADLDYDVYIVRSSTTT